MPRKKNYLNNADMLKELIASKNKDKMTDNFAKMMMLLVDRFAKRGNYIGYTFVDDMKGSALETICKNWRKFDETKYSNAFAYFTQCVYHSFLQFINLEKKQRNIRDAGLMYAGLEPSFKFSSDYKYSKNDKKPEKIDDLMKF